MSFLDNFSVDLFVRFGHTEFNSKGNNMTHADDIREIKKEFEALYEKHFEVLFEGNAAGYMDEVLAALNEQIKAAEVDKEEFGLSDVEFDYKAATGEIRSI